MTGLATPEGVFAAVGAESVAIIEATGFEGSPNALFNADGGTCFDDGGVMFLFMEGGSTEVYASDGDETSVDGPTCCKLAINGCT